MQEKNNGGVTRIPIPVDIDIPVTTIAGASL